jgi:WD40 repeat protein/serine/threonine protein kinase
LSAPGAADDRLLGRRLGDFVIEERIGEGGFGVVYKATQPLLGRPAVIKILHARLVKAGEATDRFLREAKMASSLDHPYAAHIYSSGAERDGTLWIAMEYVRGVPLSEYLRTNGPLQLERFIPLLERLCEVVHTAHEQGIVHRDIKPANVMVLSRAGRLLPKLLDFGIAKAVLDSAGRSAVGLADTQERDSAGAPARDAMPGLSPEPFRSAEPSPAAELAETMTPPASSGAIHEGALDDATVAIRRAGREVTPGLEATVMGGASEVGGDDASALDATAPPDSGPGVEATAMPDAGTRPPDSMPASMSAGALTPDSAELTRRGQIIGSPHYMAPEQWEDAAAVDARCDLYAIGVLSYEALTGKLPFQGATVQALARAHRLARPPPVPEGLPRALDPAFARALAKKPADRFDDALALATSFRASAGLSDERLPLPRLEEPVKERYLSDAPQPLAEALAALDRARELRQARDAAWAVIDVLARYLGLLALGARSRFRGVRDAAIPEALRRAGVEMLSAGDWLEIARGLSRADAGRPDLHPLPELILFFDEAGDGAEGPGRFRQLHELRGALASAAAGEGELHGRLGEAMVALSALLRRTDFVCDYPLVLGTADGGAECFTGVRRAHRQVLDPRGPRIEAGEAALCDAEGAPVLSLHPLVQVLPPAPGESPEVFYFAGGSERGGVLIAQPLPFERHDDQVVDWLRAQLDTTLDTRDSVIGHARAPYRGLEAFTPDDASVFFGRERDVDAFANRLRVEPLLAVVGPSGAGKSSFVQAGVIPAMRERRAGWHALVFRPGARPLAALASVLASAGCDLVDLEDKLHEAPAVLGDVLRTYARTTGPVILVVDQLEEILTLAGEADRHVFAAALACAVRSPDDPLRVILTLRDDFLVQAEGLAPFRERLAQALYLLTSPGPEELERILVEPARRAGYAFEDPELPARMVADVEGEPGRLALLSFTASKLWEARDRHFRRLPTRAYEELGGVGGALAHHAEALLAAMPKAEQRAVREAFRHLVTGKGTRAVLGKQELLTALGGGPAAEAAIDHLVKGRLLVVSEGEAGEQIEVAHEALLGAWPRLVEWRREDEGGARFRDQLRTASLQWQERGRPRGLLWRDDALAEYRLWRARYPGAVTEVEDAFGKASLADAARGKRRRTGLVAAAFAALATAAAFLLVLNRQADEARSLAEEQRAIAAGQAEGIRQQLLDSYLEQGSQALSNHDYHHALLFLTEAFDLGARGPEIDFMLSMAAAPFEARIATLAHEGQVWRVVFSPDSTRLAVSTGSGSAYLRDGETGELLHELRGHPGAVYGSAFDPAGELLVTGGADGSLRLWDVATGAEQGAFDHGRGNAIFAIAFAASGEIVITGAADGMARIFRVIRGSGAGAGARLEPIAEVEAHQGIVWRVDIAPDETSFVTGGDDGNVLTWELPSGSARAALRGHEGAIRAAIFDAAGTRILSASGDGSARVHDARTGRVRAELAGHAQAIQAAIFSPDGRRVATAAHDRTARIWNAESGRELAILEGHRGNVHSVEFHPQGRQLATSSADGTLRLWDAESGDLLAVLPADVRPLRLARYSPDGRRLAVPHEDGRVSLWDPEALALVRPIGDDRSAYSVRFQKDGQALVTSSRDGAVRVYRLEDDTPVFELPHDEPLRWAEMDSLGTTIVTVGESGRLTRWTLGSQPAATRIGPPDVARATAAFDPAGERLFAGGATPAIWNLATATMSLELDHGGPPIYAVGFTQDGTQLLAGDVEGTLWVLDAASGEALHSLDGHSSLIFAVRGSPDGKLSATGSRDGTSRIWDLHARETRRLITGHDGWVMDVDFSPDSALLATAGADRTIRLWGVRSGRQLARFVVSGGNVISVDFSPDGQHLATTSAGATPQLWRLPPPRIWSERELHPLRRCLPIELRDGTAAPIAALPGEC